MSDRLLKESDVLKIAFQLPLVVNSVFTDAVKALPSADRPPKVIAQITFDEEKLREIVKEAVERFKEEYEVTDRPQGEWLLKDDVFYYGCCEKESQFTTDDVYVYDMPLPNYCPNCGARMKGADDD